MGKITLFRRNHRLRPPRAPTPTSEKRGWSAAALRLAALACIMFGLLAYQATGLALPGSRYESGGGGPVHVIDGDTFDYQGTRVRIADIDTPEVHGRCAYETELAARATQRMRMLLAAGPFEMHQLASGRDEDRYGRKLRIVTRGGRSLGDTLVSEGLARTWTGRREPWCV
jgi:endonuclease YncB( thermonuclease family)